jgi:transcriptional antiterminator RfaH
MRTWVVARTQPNRAAWAAENILRQFAEPYLPRCLERVKVNGHFEVRPKLLFPGYVFVRLLDGRWRFLMGTFGVASVIMMGNQPAVVQDSEIARIKAYEDIDGLIHLPDKEILAATFKQGSSVRITDGPYSGYVGVCEGTSVKDRERILLEYLGRKTRVLIGAAQLEQEEG